MSAVDQPRIIASAGTGGSINPTGSVSVPNGHDKPFTITPIAGYHIFDVLVDNSSVGAVSEYNFINVTTDHTISAIFSINGYTLSYTAGPGGSISGLSPQTVSAGGFGSPVTAVPDTGYHFVQWSDGVLSAERTDTNVQADINVTASFALDGTRTFTITVSANSGGSISPSGAVTVNEGNSQAFTIIPDIGYHITDVLVDASSVGAVTTYTFTNVTSDHTIAATFSINSYTLSYAAGLGGSIAGTSSQIVSYGGTGSLVTAVPDTGYHFVQWSDGVLSTERTDTNVQSDINLTASFALDGTLTFTITATAGLGGSISPPGTVTIDQGNGQSFVIIPDIGYHITDVLVDALSVGAMSDYTFTNVTADHTIAASFSIDNYTLAYTAGVGGSISGISPQTASYGGSGTEVTAVPDNGYHFVQWSDGILTPARIDTNVTANISAAADFAVNMYTVIFDLGTHCTLTGGQLTQTVAQGAGATAPIFTTEAGWTFTGWNKDFTNITANLTVNPVFVQNEYTLTINITGSGDVSRSPNQATYHYGDVVILTPGPAAGWSFGGWSGDINGSTNPERITIYFNKTATATFVQQQPGGFDSQVVGIGLSGTSPVIDGNGRVLSEGQIKTADDKLNLTIPVGVYIWNAAGASQSFLSASPLPDPAQAPANNSVVLAYEMGPNGVTFTPAIILTIKYADGDLPVGSSEADLYLAWWDGTTWVKLAGTVNPSANTVTVQITHFTSFALLASAPSQTPVPTLKIVSPSTGTSSDPGSATLSINAGNISLVTGNRSNAAGEGRVIYYLDVIIPTVPGQSALTTPGTFKESALTSNTWTGLAPGTHTLGIQLVQNDYTPFDPPISATTSVVVNAPVNITTAAQIPTPEIPGIGVQSPTGLNPIVIAGILLMIAVALGLVLYKRRELQPARNHQTVPLAIDKVKSIEVQARNLPLPDIPANDKSRVSELSVRKISEPQSTKILPPLEDFEGSGEYIIRLHNVGAEILGELRDYIKKTPDIRFLELNTCYTDIQLNIRLEKGMPLVKGLCDNFPQCKVKRNGKIILVNSIE